MGDKCCSPLLMLLVIEGLRLERDFFSSVILTVPYPKYSTACQYKAGGETNVILLLIILAVFFPILCLCML